jgi:hypothetical protein
LYKNLLHKGEFGQAHCEEWLKRIHKKIYFVIFEHSYKFLRILEVSNNFCYLKQLEKQLNFWAQYWAETGPGLQPARRGGLSRAAGRQAGWATAWRPSPAALRPVRTRGHARAARVRGVVTACGTAWWHVCRRPDGG